MRYLLRSSLSVLLAFCMVFSNSYSAIANTTTEQIYDIMPLAIPSYTTLTMQAGVFNPNNDSYSFSNSVTLSEGSDYLYSALSYTFPEVRDFYPAVRFNFNGSSSYNPSIGEPFNSSFRFLLSNNGFYYANSDFSKSMTLLDVAQPFNAFATVTYKYNYQIYDEDTQSWYQRSATQAENVPLSVSLSSPDTNSSNYIWDLSFSANEPKFDKGDQVRNVSGFIQSVSMTVVYSSFGSMYVGTPLSVGESGIIVASSYDTQIFYSNVNGSTGSSSSTGVSNAISSVSKQVTQVSTKLSSVQTSIESKITTMSSDIQAGLQNVVQSAQQNTQNIINTVTQKVDEVKTGITEVKDSILDLPNKLEEKVLSLVVPEEDVIESKFSEIEDLLRGRFGLIYQAEEVIVDFANSLQTSTATTEASGGKIIFPSVVVNLPDETVFNFGGYEVDLIPDGFETLANAVRLAVNMVCTAIFINMCKNKLEVIFK